ncbi:hypothetical protein FLK61_29780 [Paenalkalicoccus suaedae]|uniref:Uncharacterized protein n=1 Tax=Paenalkalicoccus suaedae TaxID=2592382 RepID=A0A859FFA1_9BACI|nr:hypothetical protein [Paenalkalicoccus suaedae]QKS70916.1 hypothetical protein FLK61_29780 [Paenalkalicoccus suaedae]
MKVLYLVLSIIVIVFIFRGWLMEIGLKIKPIRRLIVKQLATRTTIA